MPIIDLRAKFELPSTEYDKFTVIIVVMVEGRASGMVVDAVSDVLNIPESEIQSTPEFSSQTNTDFISGMGKAGEKLIILLDINKVVGIDEIKKLAS